MAKKTKKRIILTGAHGTGKTTLMNEACKGRYSYIVNRT